MCRVHHVHVEIVTRDFDSTVSAVPLFKFPLYRAALERLETDATASLIFRGVDQARLPG